MAKWKENALYILLQAMGTYLIRTAMEADDCAFRIATVVMSSIAMIHLPYGKNVFNLLFGYEGISVSLDKFQRNPLLFSWGSLVFLGNVWLVGAGIWCFLNSLLTGGGGEDARRKCVFSFLLCIGGVVYRNLQNPNRNLQNPSVLPVVQGESAPRTGFLEMKRMVMWASEFLITSCSAVIITKIVENDLMNKACLVAIAGMFISASLLYFALVSKGTQNAYTVTEISFLAMWLVVSIIFFYTSLSKIVTEINSTVILGCILFLRDAAAVWISHYLSQSREEISANFSQVLGAEVVRVEV